jgi:hypothetical protein
VFPVRVRSSPREWLGNETDTPRETCQEILSHTVYGVQGAYGRSSSTAKKRAAPESWGAYLAKERLVVDLIGV